jgi:hypothetical protein
MIIHNIDMTKINDPVYSKIYESKMLELLPEWEKFLTDPFGRNLLVKKTKKFKDFKVIRTYMIFYKPKSAAEFDEEKTETEKLWGSYREIIK